MSATQFQVQRASLKEFGSCTWQAQVYCAGQKTPKYTVGCSHELIKGGKVTSSL